MNGIEQIRDLVGKLPYPRILRNKLAAEIAVMIFDEAMSDENCHRDVRLDGITSSKLQKYLSMYDFVCALPEEKTDRMNAWSKAPNHLRSVFGGRELSADEKNCFAVLFAALEDRYEKYDGSGYPKGKRRDDICLLAHITGIADLVANKKLHGVAEKDILIALDEVASTYYSPSLIETAKKVVSKHFDSDREWFGHLGEGCDVQMEYQPIFDGIRNVSVARENRMILRDKNGDGMTPEIYVPVAERTGRATGLSLLQLEEACQIIAFGRMNGAPEPRPVWISVPATCFTKKIFPLTVKRIFKKYSVYPETFVFQITETALGLEDPTLKDTVAELREIGVKIAVEHFGNEYSSLALLADFDADTVKLDRIFSESVAENKKTFEIIKSLVVLGENLGVRVVATGVDTASAKDMLTEAGVRYMQGEIFGGFEAN